MAKTQDSKEVTVPEKQLPLFVQYLSADDTPYDCWFHVVDPDKPKDPPEKIGGGKLHLMSHSVLFRRMLHESPLAETGPITVTDIKPATFRHLLRFLHGHFDITYLCLEEAVALLYAAEKYFVDDLCQRLGEHIASLISVDNIFLPMMKEECFREETLKKAMQKIIQEETKKLVAKEEFLGLNTVGILSIVTQGCLQISEIELWRAVLRWAKHQGETDKSEELREDLSESLKHIRFCTMGANEFNKEVATTGILTDSEIASVVKILGGASSLKIMSGKTDFSELNSISYNVDARSLFSEEEFEINFSGETCSVPPNYFYLTTEENTVQLLSATLAEVKSSTVNNNWCAPKKSRFKCECNVTLLRITNYGNNASTEQPIEFRFVEDVLLDSSYVISFPEEMKLWPLEKYKLAMSFKHQQECLRSESKNATLSNRGLLVSSDKEGFLYSRVLSLKYKVL